MLNRIFKLIREGATWISVLLYLALILFLWLSIISSGVSQPFDYKRWRDVLGYVFGKCVFAGLIIFTFRSFQYYRPPEDEMRSWHQQNRRATVKTLALAGIVALLFYSRK